MRGDILVLGRIFNYINILIVDHFNVGNVWEIFIDQTN
jgi:hypothetical protein